MIRPSSSRTYSCNWASVSEESLSRPPIDESWLQDQLAELARLADEGDTLEVVNVVESEDPRFRVHIVVRPHPNA